MEKLSKWIVWVLVLLLCPQLTSCSDDDEPSLPAGVTTEKQEAFIACLTSNYGELPSYATTLYEDAEFQYRVAARSNKYELIILPYRKQDGDWIACYTYDANESVGDQLKPIKYNDSWLCSIMSCHVGEASLENITGRLSFSEDSYLSVTPFNYRGCYYGYLTVAGGKKVNVKLFCSFLKMDRKQGSSTFGYITNAKLEYQFY